MELDVKEKKLNKQQRAAVRYKQGPLLIIAGAGTGKTTVITERIKFLIEKGLAKPSEILALTFTEKAAQEMEGRVDVAMPYGYTQMWISTFHAFCDRVLREEIIQIGFYPKYKLMTGAESIQFIRKNLFEFELKYFRPLGNPNKFIDGMLAHFGRLQDEDVAPSEYLSWVKKQGKSQKKVRASHSAKSLRDDSASLKSLLAESKIELDKWGELARAYRKYEELKAEESVMDFGDLITKTLLLFRKRPNVLSAYRKRFKYILVDEFQDTNFAQNELAMLLAGRNGNITVTGDDDQSIYRFRGAAVSNIVHFRKKYKKAKIVVLTKNYRSTQKILDRAYKLVKNNDPDRLEVVENINKKLVSQVTKDGEDIEFIHENRVENEAEFVAGEIGKLVESGKYNYKDCAILVRANNHSEAFIRALQRSAIPHQFLGPGKLFKQEEIIELVSYLRVLYDFDDSVSLYKVLSIDYFNVNPRDLVKLGNYARRYNLSLFDACKKTKEIAVSNETKEKVAKIVNMVNEHIRYAKKESAGQILYKFLEETGIIQEFVNPDSEGVEKRIQNISKFFDKLKNYETNHEDASVAAVVDWIELLNELGESPLAADTDWTEVDAVNILTIHSAKGLEFPVVFLVNLVSQRFPTTKRREQIPIPTELIKEELPEGDYHIQEERRLFYVGMTRAREKLFFTASDFYGEGKRVKKLSPFIFESLGDDVISSENSKDKSEQLTFLEYKAKKAKPQKPFPQNHIDYLSYSQIDTFRICPLHYKLKYILKIPTLATAPLSFGISVHDVMKDFYLQIRDGRKPTKRLMKKLLEERWQGEGYKSKSHENEMFEQGLNYLDGFLKYGFDSKVKPVALEKSFVVPLLQPKKRYLKIGGTIDRVDRLPGGRIEIIDYKTGERVPTQKQVEKDLLQLSFYALAATQVSEPPFGKRPQEIIVSYYFFSEQKKISVKISRQQLANTKKEIFKWRDEIENSDFACSKNYLCKKCEYDQICNFSE